MVEAIKGDKPVPTAFVAEFCGVTPRYCNKLADDGHMERLRKGQFNLLASLRGYIAFLQTKARVRGNDPGGESEDLMREKVRLTHHQANKTALEEQVLRGDLITADEVERVWSGMVGAFRARMLSVPGRAAQSVIATADISEAEQIIRGLVHEALSELADYDPEHYRSNRGKGQRANGATAEPDGQPVGGRRKATVQRGQRRTRPVEH